MLFYWLYISVAVSFVALFLVLVTVSLCIVDLGISFAHSGSFCSLLISRDLASVCCSAFDVNACSPFFISCSLVFSACNLFSDYLSLLPNSSLYGSITCILLLNTVWCLIQFSLLSNSNCFNEFLPLSLFFFFFFFFFFLLFNIYFRKYILQIYSIQTKS